MASPFISHGDHHTPSLRQSSPSTTEQSSELLEDDEEQVFLEAQLRQLYEEEEVNRFLRFFSAHVTEVRVPSTSNSRGVHLSETGPSTRHGGLTPPPLPRRPYERSLSEHVAYNYLLPYLPRDGRLPSQFTVKRLRLTGQRLYLTIVPPYHAFLLNMSSLALWRNKQRSLLYCILFWTLWYYNLLLAAFLCQLLWRLLRRRLFPYPTLAELQEKRQATAEAHLFVEEVERRLSASTLGPVQLWELFRFYRTATHHKAKRVARDKLLSIHEPEDHGSGNTSEHDNGQIFLEDDEESREARLLRQDLLHLLDIIADTHERIKNTFTWRRPAATRRYALLLLSMTILALILPAHHIAKLICMFSGFIFWHIVPIIAALSPADRARVPAVFGDVPTDAEYSMELIGRRVANGQNVRIRNQKRSQCSNTSVDSVSLGAKVSQPFEETSGIDWKKWGARLAQGKSFFKENKSITSMSRVLFTKMSREQSTCNSSGLEETLTLGLITLTSQMIHFSSLTNTHAEFNIPRSQLQGVRKAGVMEGLTITWIPNSSNVESSERVERFHWVGNRDELFVRLLGPDAGRWMRV